MKLNHVYFIIALVCHISLIKNIYACLSIVYLSLFSSRMEFVEWYSTELNCAPKHLLNEKFITKFTQNIFIYLTKNVVFLFCCYWNDHIYSLFYTLIGKCVQEIFANLLYSKLIMIFCCCNISC